jgi:hypothetical protein
MAFSSVSSSTGEHSPSAGSLLARNAFSGNIQRGRLELVETGVSASVDPTLQQSCRLALITQSANGNPTQAGMFVSNFAPAVVGAGKASNESMGVYVLNASADPSTYSGGGTGTPLLLADCVGIDTRGYIVSPNSAGRAWGIYSLARALASSQGQLMSGEFAVENDTGVAAPASSTSTQGQQKNGILLDSTGTASNSSALWIRGSTGTNSQWLYGVYGTAADIVASTGYFVRYEDVEGGNALFTVAQSGQQAFKVGSSIKDATDNASAATAGVPVGGVYYDSTSGNAMRVRTA